MQKAKIKNDPSATSAIRGEITDPKEE